MQAAVLHLAEMCEQLGEQPAPRTDDSIQTRDELCVAETYKVQEQLPPHDSPQARHSSRPVATRSTPIAVHLSIRSLQVVENLPQRAARTSKSPSNALPPTRASGALE